MARAISPPATVTAAPGWPWRASAFTSRMKKRSAPPRCLPPMTCKLRGGSPGRIKVVRSKRQYEVGRGLMDHAAEVGLDFFQRGGIVGLETQHDHRRGVRRAREAETVGVLDAQTVERDDFLGIGEARGFLQRIHQCVMLAFGHLD